jgi:hypothetical protein
MSEELSVTGQRHPYLEGIRQHVPLPLDEVTSLSASVEAKEPGSVSHSHWMKLHHPEANPQPPNHNETHSFFFWVTGRLPSLGGSFIIEEYVSVKNFMKFLLAVWIDANTGKQMTSQLQTIFQCSDLHVCIFVCPHCPTMLIWH